MKAVWKIALRYLFAKKSHSAVNIISIISVAGVAVATMATVCVLSVFNGFTQLAMGRLSMVDPDIRIESTSAPVFYDSESLAASLERLPEVGLVSPTLTGQALAVFDGRQIPVTIKGVTDDYRLVSRLDSAVIDGEFQLHRGDYSGVVMSVGTAIRLGARPGFWQPLAVYVPKRLGRVNPANPMTAFRSDSLVVTGVYQINQSEYDADMIILPLEDVRRLLDYDEGSPASALEVRLADGVDEAEGMKAVTNLLGRMGGGFNALDRLQQESTSFRMINMEKWISFIMLAFILIIASFNVISTLSMIIIEKRYNLSTLRAMGASESMIARIFMVEGWLISVFGGLVGIILGSILCLLQQWFGFIKLVGDPTQMSIDVYHVRLMFPDLVAVLLLVALVGLMIGWTASRFTRRI